MTDAAADESGSAVGRIALGLVGLLVLVVAVAADGPVRGAVGTLQAVAGSEYLLVAVIGLVTLGTGIAAFVTSRDAATQTRTPDPERAVPVPAPGEPFDETAGDWRCLLPGAGREQRDTVRRRLRRTAVETVAVTDDCARETAASRVADGTWTSDPVAAAYLAEAADPAADSGRFGRLLRGRTPTQYRAERTVSAIADVAGATEEAEG